MKEVRETIVLTSAIDDFYSPLLGALISSIAENTENKLKYYLFDCGISLKNLNRFKKLSQKYNIDLIVKKQDMNLLDKHKLTNHYSLAGYMTLLIPDILKELNEEKVIFLDADLIVLGEIKNLWDIEIKKESIAAVKDYYNDSAGKWKELGLKDADAYFNSGVMLINIQNWSKDSIKEKATDFAMSNPQLIDFIDQDALNGAVKGNYKRIDNKYNCTKTPYPNLKIFNRKSFPINESQIIHFIGEEYKPWNFLCINSNKKYYWKYLRKTPWKFSVYKDLKKVTLKTVFKKYFKLLKIFINQQGEIFNFIKKIRNMFSKHH